MKNQLFIVLFCCLSVAAQPVLLAQNVIANSTLAGKYALQFQVYDFFQFDNFQGGVISGKYYFNESTAVRFGTEIGFSNTDSFYDREYFDSENEFEDNREEDRINIDFRLQLLIIEKLSADDIYFYFGGGPSIGFASQKLKVESQAGEAVTMSKSDRVTNSYGFNVVAGTEWFFSKSMSLSLEYDTAFIFAVSEEKSEDDYSKFKRTDEAFRIRSNQVKLGLSILL